LAAKSLAAHAEKQIRTAVSTELVDLAKARNVTALTDHGYGYRLRVGRYRASSNSTVLYAL